ncbi:MAG: hypothetical protein OXF44_00345 [Anaerolineaceae bacterium]|nr:hypothetical protein [Anaerolineaceae bacterium]
MIDFWQRLAAAPPDIPQAFAVDPDGAPVLLAREEWAHIQEGHPEMLALRDLIIQAVSAPDHVKKEDPAGNFIHYFKVVPPKLSAEMSARDHEILVVVKYLYPPEAGGQRTGFVSTAYSPPLGEKR